MINKIQVLDANGNIYYLETEADIVKVTSSDFTGTNVLDVLEEINDKKVEKGTTWNELEGN